MKKLENIKFALDTIKNKFGIALNNNEIYYEENINDITIYFDRNKKFVGFEVDNISNHVENLMINVVKVGFDKIFNVDNKQINEKNFNILKEKINELKEVNK